MDCITGGDGIESLPAELWYQRLFIACTSTEDKDGGVLGLAWPP